MVFWIIPYLVAYNISGTVQPNGLKAIFEATVRSHIRMENISEEKIEIAVTFGCTLKNLNYLDCKVNEATEKSYGVQASKGPLPPTSNATAKKFDPLIDADFRIEFDEFGIKEISFPTTRGFFRQSMLRSIAGNLNVGIDLNEKKLGIYTTLEKSINGYCDTIYNITKIPKQAIEKIMNVGSPTLRIDAFPAITKEETISIAKLRNMKKCHKSTPYVFGRQKLSEADKKEGLRVNINVPSSRSEILLGTNRFNSYTENTILGYMKMENASVPENRRVMRGRTEEFIHLSLVSIIPVTDSN